MQGARTRSRPAERLDCGLPLDSQYFDRSGFLPLPAVGATAVLARMELPPEYCGVLEYFSQYTDLLARDPAEVRTPGLRWQVLANGEPLSPYHAIDSILNPWGYGSFQFAIRLPHGAAIEIVARRMNDDVTGSGKAIATLGARLVGRYWYDTAYGGAR
jgi:hypothetical protein